MYTNIKNNTSKEKPTGGTGLISNEDVKKLQEMGFKTAIIYKAADIAQKESKNILDVVIQLQDSEEPSSQANSSRETNQSSTKRNDSNQSDSPVYSNGSSQSGNGSNSSNAQLQKSQKSGDYDVLTIDMRLRSAGTPVGLLNYGNTCYFNSLIQTYFFIPKFMETIMKYRSPKNLNLEQLTQDRQRRILASINLVNNLQKLFGYMILSDKRYADPKAVLENIVDHQGNRIIMGDQKDIGEFNLQFLERLEEGLKYQEGKNYDFSGGQNGSGLKPNSSQNPITVDLLSVNNQGTGQLKKKMSFVTSDDQDSVMNQLFFGKKKEFTTYYSAGQFKHQSEENVFSPIILDLQYQDLYTSWENNSTFYVEDFKDENGKVTEAEKAGWITKAPEVLMFQIQRVVYIKEKGVAEKLNSPFQFEKEIYIDRFLLDNRSYIVRNKPKLKALKKKRDMIMGELAKLKNYENSKLSIVKIVDMTMQFLLTPEKLFENLQLEEDKFSPKTQSLLTGITYNEVSDFSLENNTSNTNISQSTIHIDNKSNPKSSSSVDLLSLFEQPTITPAPPTPNSMSSTIFGDENQFNSINNTKHIQEPAFQQNKPKIEQISFEKKQIDPRIQQLNDHIEQFNESKKNILQDTFVQAINNLKSQTSILIQSLEEELKKTNDEIDSIYQNLKQVKYVLHAILIHQGFADSGHYFSYIRSHDQKKWFKFNDIQVVEEDEQQVMKQAVGDGKSSAYCLVYVKECRLKENKYKHSFELMGDSIESNIKVNKLIEETPNSSIIIKKKQHVVIDLLNLEGDSDMQSSQKQNSNMISNQDTQEIPQQELIPIRNLVQDDLKREILSSNRQQQVELEQFKQIHLADSIVDNYSKRFAFINEYIRKSYDKNKKLSYIPPLTNFGVYLRWLNENVTDIQKVQLLDCAIREISQQKMMLSDLPNHQILYNRLVNNFEGMGEFKSPGKLVLTPRDYDVINKEYTKFLQKVSCAFAIHQAFDLILNNQIIESLDYFHYIQKFAVLNDYFYRMCRDMFKVLLLKASCQLFEMTNEQNEVLLKQIKFILLYSSKLSEGDTTPLQIHKILSEYMRYIGQNKLAASRDKIQLFIASLIDYEKLQQQFQQYLTNQEKHFEELETTLMEKAMKSEKYFWKTEDVNMEMESQINQKFQKINTYLREYINFHQNLVKYKNVLDLNERISNNYQVSLPK